MSTVYLSPELHRHAQKYALMRHKTLRQIVAEAVSQYTRYESTALAVKWVPRVPSYTTQDIDAVIG